MTERDFDDARPAEEQETTEDGTSPRHEKAPALEDYIQDVIDGYGDLESGLSALQYRGPGPVVPKQTPETATQETASPETATPEAAASETATSETATSETATLETASPETATPETATPETAQNPLKDVVNKTGDFFGDIANKFVSFFGF